MIGVLGNLANVGHQFARFLSEAGHPATLLLRERDLPQWRHYNPEGDPYRNPRVRVVPEPLKGLNLLYEAWSASRCELLISICLAGMRYLPFLGRPYVSYATGADLRELAGGVGYSGLQVHQARLAFRRARLVFFSPEQSHIDMIRRLELRHVVPWRQFVDTRYWSAPPPTAGETLRIFHPTNHVWKEKFPGQGLKRNEVVFRGFREFLDRGGRGRLSYLRRGQDVVATEQLVAELRLEPHVEAIGGELNRDQLKEKVLAADLIADQFGVGTMGLIALEALSACRPVIAYFAEEMMALAYPPPAQGPPLLNARTPGEVADRLLEVQDPSRLVERALAGRAWIDRYHAPLELARWYWNHIQSRLAL